jgi:deoxyribose-phosphate aldolase
MFDWNSVKDRAIAEKVKKEAFEFMGRCHFGSQGIAKTEEDVKQAAKRLIDSGFHATAFDTEMNYVGLVKSMLEGISPIHCAVAYPMGRMLLNKKLRDLEILYDLGVRDVCVCLDWQAIFSHRYSDIEHEARIIMKQFGNIFIKNALVIPATLMSDTEIIATCRALDSAGVVSVKVNPGAKLNVSFEEVGLIQRVFPERFDIHPSGGIRTLEAVEKYLKMGCSVIHTVSSLDLTEQFILRQIEKYEATRI